MEKPPEKNVQGLFSSNVHPNEKKLETPENSVNTKKTKKRANIRKTEKNKNEMALEMATSKYMKEVDEIAGTDKLYLPLPNKVAPFTGAHATWRHH